MIGIVPSQTKTFDVIGSIGDSREPIEGSLYVDPANGRLYLYSATMKRSSPETGYFPIWDGSSVIITKFSNDKRLETDVIRTDLASMSSTIDGAKASQIKYQQMRSVNESILQPVIAQGDNMFTQTIKAIICLKQLTLIDLVYMSSLPEKVIRNYYSALTKITFMRLDRWKIWLSQIFHLSYKLSIYRGNTKLISYAYPSEVFDSGLIKYDAIVSATDDPYKKLVKIVMTMENIGKADLRSDEVDDYTINNMLTTINTGKQLSAQLFSRFIRITGLNFTIDILEKNLVTGTDELIFTYSE